MREFDFVSFFELAIELSAQKDLSVLFERILREAMVLTSSDAGTMYVLEENELQPTNMITLSQNIDKSSDREEIEHPPVPLNRDHICAVSAIDKRLINISNVYESEDFDFSSSRTYDTMTGYYTGAMLVVPMLDEDHDCVGILQLINPMKDGSIISYTDEDELVIRALTSFAAISLNNRKMSHEIHQLLHSFVQTMVDAIDTRSPYNANHTRKMVAYAEGFLKWVEETGADFHIKEKKKEPFIMSVWLHDIGKLLIPMEIMDKSTRLGTATERVLHRIVVAILMEKISGTPERIAEIEEARDFILKINNVGYLDDEKREKIHNISKIMVKNEKDETIPLLTKNEVESLSIKRGTLTPAERRIIEDHVVYTKYMLLDMHFFGRYKCLPEIAAGHHEFLDGSGYPDHKKEKDISQETRLLTILDIYDALTAEDRPYKPPETPENAFGILQTMADMGKVDGHILSLFKESKAWII